MHVFLAVSHEAAEKDNPALWASVHPRRDHLVPLLKIPPELLLLTTQTRRRSHPNLRGASVERRPLESGLDFVQQPV